jgi:hypothetical protein
METISMKKIIILFTLVISFINYCCEKEDGTTPGNSNDYRLKEVIVEFNFDQFDISASMKIVFTYEGEQYVKETYYESYNDAPWEEYGKTVVTYEGDNITGISYDKEDEEWIISGKSEIIYINGLKKREKTYSYDEGDWTLTSETTYSYNGTDLISGIDKDYDDDMEKKTEYIYENSTLSEIRRYVLDDDSEWEQTHEETYYHTGDKVTSIIFSERDKDEWINTEKLEFEYTADGNLDVMTSVEWDDSKNNWETMGKTVEFSYDANGYITEMSDDDLTLTYIWEKGKSNLGEIYDYDVLPYGVNAMSD